MLSNQMPLEVQSPFRMVADGYAGAFSIGFNPNSQGFIIYDDSDPNTTVQMIPGNVILTSGGNISFQYTGQLSMGQFYIIGSQFLENNWGKPVFDYDHQYFDKNGAKILDVQQGQIGTISDDLAQHTAAINALINAMRAHGLIAVDV